MNNFKEIGISLIKNKAAIQTDIKGLESKIIKLYRDKKLRLLLGKNLNNFCNIEKNKFDLFWKELKKSF